MTPDLATVTTRELLDEIEIRCKNRPCYGGNPPPVVDPVEIPGARVTIIEGRRHDYYQWDNGETHIAGCPSWKSRDHFAATHGLGMAAKHIGALLLTVDGDEHWIRPLLTRLTPAHQFQEVRV